ncbi:hypothetical protein Tcan_07304 [Toxocara canis]|uniref:UPAR/Ly6 domain-containing protein n=1 Tax=Toxocara canis TaxID=6265 RepID=A0A0B2V8N7_TOXCA|nr:hypothetical protein Tcan_07304 [Toxocara canis]
MTMLSFIFLPIFYLDATSALRCIDDTQNGKLVTCSGTNYCLWLYGKDKSSSSRAMVTFRSCYNPLQQDFCDHLGGMQARINIRNLDGGILQVVCCKSDGCNKNIKPPSSSGSSTASSLAPFLFVSTMNDALCFLVKLLLLLFGFHIVHL